MISKATIGTTPVRILDVGERRGVILQNQSDTDIYFTAEGTSGVTTDSGASPGIRLIPGATFTAGRPNLGETGLGLAWWAVCASASKVLVVHSW